MAKTEPHVPMIDLETNKVLDVLKVMAQEMSRNDIIDLTKEEVKWAPNPGNKMMRIIGRADGKIVRTKHGYYAHRDYIDKFGKFHTVPVSAPKPPEEKKEPTPPRVVVPTKPVDEVKPSSDSLKLLQSFKQETSVPSKNPIILPPLGVEFEGVVTGIETYGVFVEKPNTRFSGLIHVSNIRDGIPPTYEELTKRFRVGQEIRCKVAGHRPGKKLAFTMRGMPIPPIVEPGKEVDPRLQVLEQVKPRIAEERAVMASTPAPNDAHFEELVQFLTEKFGKVSDPARGKLGAIWAKHGMFKIMMSLAKAVEQFDADVSYMFALEMEKQMGDSL